MTEIINNLSVEKELSIALASFKCCRAAFTCYGKEILEFDPTVKAVMKTRLLETFNEFVCVTSFLPMHGLDPFACCSYFRVTNI